MAALDVEDPAAQAAYLDSDWAAATTEPGAFALGTTGEGWAVSEVKLKRLTPE